MSKRKTPSYMEEDIITEKKRKIISPTAKSKNQKEYIKEIESKEIVICKGLAGTGKTHIAIGMALNFFTKGLVNKIIIARPAIEAGENLGYLPGDMEAKVSPYLRPIFDELNYFVDIQTINFMRDNEELEIAPIAFMRGRTLRDAFIICDESQNLTYEQMKMLLTRFGQNSRMVLTGDVDQSDLSHSKKGAFGYVWELFKNDDEIGTICLTESDIQRHALVGKISEKWEKSLDEYKKSGTIIEG